MGAGASAGNGGNAGVKFLYEDDSADKNKDHVVEIDFKSDSLEESVAPTIIIIDKGGQELLKAKLPSDIGPGQLPLQVKIIRDPGASEARDLYAKNQKLRAELAAAKKSAKKPIEDTAALLEAFECKSPNASSVPLAVKVAEVEALQLAIVKAQLRSHACERQLNEMKKFEPIIKRFNEHASFKKDMDHMAKEKQEAAGAAKTLADKFENQRDAAISEFTPAMMDSLANYEERFKSILAAQKDAVAALAKVPDLCAEMTKPGKPKQDLPSNATDPTSLTALMLLMQKSKEAMESMRQVADAASRSVNGLVSTTVSVNEEQASCEVLHGPLKGLERAMQKAQEDYDGDYTRLVDFVRCTLVFEEVALLVDALAWFASPDGAVKVGFEPARAKDRLSLKFDAALSGGNRDVLMNGYLTLADGSRFAAEIQLHVKSLFELKKGLHVLYDGVRVLGAADPSISTHQGLLSQEVLQRADQGVVRNLLCEFSDTKDNELPNRLAQMIQREGCTVLMVNLNGWTNNDKCGLMDWTLDKLFLGDGRLQHPTCVHLRSLKLSCTGLTGTIPDWFFSSFPKLEVLTIHRSRFNIKQGGNDDEKSLSGPIPENLGDCVNLKTLYLFGNKLTGSIPKSVANLHKLESIALFDQPMSGPIPVQELLSLPKLTKLNLGKTNLTVSEEDKKMFAEKGITLQI